MSQHHFLGANDAIVSGDPSFIDRDGHTAGYVGEQTGVDGGFNPGWKVDQYSSHTYTTHTRINSLDSTATVDLEVNTTTNFPEGVNTGHHPLSTGLELADISDSPTTPVHFAGRHHPYQTSELSDRTADFPNHPSDQWFTGSQPSQVPPAPYCFSEADPSLNSNFNLTSSNASSSLNAYSTPFDRSKPTIDYQSYSATIDNGSNFTHQAEPDLTHYSTTPPNPPSIETPVAREPHDAPDYLEAHFHNGDYHAHMTGYSGTRIPHAPMSPPEFCATHILHQASSSFDQDFSFPNHTPDQFSFDAQVSHPPTQPQVPAVTNPARTQARSLGCSGPTNPTHSGPLVFPGDSPRRQRTSPSHYNFNAHNSAKSWDLGLNNAAESSEDSLPDFNPSNHTNHSPPEINPKPNATFGDALFEPNGLYPVRGPQHFPLEEQTENYQDTPTIDNNTSNPTWQTGLDPAQTYAMQQSSHTHTQADPPMALNPVQIQTPPLESSDLLSTSHSGPSMFSGDPKNPHPTWPSHGLPSMPPQGPELSHRQAKRKRMGNSQKRKDPHPRVKNLKLQCPDPRCGKWFEKPCELKRHVARHDGTRYFMCAKCGEQRITKDQVIIHYVKEHIRGGESGGQVTDEERAKARPHVIPLQSPMT